MSDLQDQTLSNQQPVILDHQISTQWYYVVEENRVGPISREEIEQLIKQGTVRKYTPVRNGEGDWQLADDFKELSKLAFDSDPVPASNKDPYPIEAPPVGLRPIDNRLVWLIIFMPILSIIGDFLVTPNRGSGWIFYALYVGACALDARKLKTDGYPIPKAIWMFLPIPFYLWKRAKILKQSQLHTILSFTFLCILLLINESFLTAFDIHMGIGADRELPRKENSKELLDNRP